MIRFVSRSRFAVVLSVLAFALTFAAGAAGVPTPIPLPTTDGSLLAKAAPDECFNGIGVNYPPGPPCAAGKPKVNQAYVWGLAKTGNDLWFGTMANTQCLVEGGYLGVTTPSVNASAVCEFGQSQLVRLGLPPTIPPNALPPAIGDFRPPHIYVYNLGTQTLTEKTVPVPVQAALNTTLGLRAAGTLNDVVLLAGPGLTPGLNMFAFRASTGAFLGYTNFPAYTNIRKFVVVGGVLYAGVGRKPTSPPSPGEKTGRVLRWNGTVNPITFDEVGVIDSMASEITDHEGRLFVTSWPDTELAASSGKQAGLYMSPTIPVGGFVAPATDWTKVWTASDYERDPVTAATYGGGALASFGGYLYWGTMHVPYLAALAHFNVYASEAPTDTQGQATWLLNSNRAISIFRGRNFATVPALDVVYGYPTMPAYVKTGPAPGAWTSLPNGMSPPLRGGPGFDNPFNNYTWTMALYDNRLWVGTMDWSWLAADSIGSMLPGGIPGIVVPGATTLGADLWYFPSANSPALPESINGVGNPSSYGIRNMVSGPDLYLGMANPMNLLTDPAAGPLGGWELIKLTAKPKNTPAGNNVTVPLDGGASIDFCHVQTAGYTLSKAVPLDGLPAGAPALGNVVIHEVLAVGSTADWRTGCPTGNLAQMSVSIPGLPDNAVMYELYWDPATGRHGWRIITSGHSGNTLRGTLDAQFAGVIVIVSFRTIPALSDWMQLALIAALALSGAAMLARRRRRAA